MSMREDFSLRPVEAKDLEKILEWRNSDRIRNYMYTDHLISIEEHQAWFLRLKDDLSSLYFIFEIQAKPFGLVYFTDIDKKNKKSNWGFYLGEPDAPRGSGVAMGVLGLECAFTQLNLRKLCGEAFVFNDASIRFHKKLGFVEEGRFSKHVLKNGVYEDVVTFALFFDDWCQLRPVLDITAFPEEKVGK